MRFGKALWFAGSMLAVTTGPAWAQSADDNEIIVTATKRAENVQDVAASVTPLTAEMLALGGVSNAEDIGNLAPSVAVDSNANFVAPYIRGVGTQYANPGLEPSVAIYLDDLYVSRASAGLLTLADIERVEVLRGPQGTLYGMSNTGGAIRVITAAPTDQLAFGGSVAFGNNGQRIGDVYLSGPLASNVRGRISAQIDQNDGYVEPINGIGPTLEDRDLFSVRGRLAWDVTDRLSVQIMADYTDKEDHEGQAFLSLFSDPSVNLGQAFGGQGSEGFDRYGGNYTDDTDMDLEAGGIEVRVDYELNNVTLSSISGYRSTEFVGNADLDTTTAPLLHGQTNAELTQAFSQEFQAVSNYDGPFNYTVGLHLYNENGKDGFGFGGLAINAASGLPLAPPFAGAFGEGRVVYESWAPYANMQYQFTPQWEVVLGGRYTSTEKTLEYNNLFGGILEGDGFTFDHSTAVLLASEPSRTFESDTFTPLIGLNWTPTEDILIYASATRGYKSGGFNLPQPAGLVGQVEDEQLTAYELGWKTQFGAVTLNGSIFHYQAEDLQVQITDPTAGITSVINAGESETTGIELEGQWYATEHLTIGGNVSYIHSEFVDFPNGPVNVPCNDPATIIAYGQNPAVLCAAGGTAAFTADLTGNQLPFAPEWSASLRADYSLPLANNGGTFHAGLVASYKSEIFFTPDNRFSQDAYTLLSGSVGWTSPSEKWDVSVYGSNLTDEEYVVHVAPFSTGGWYNRGAPLMYGVRIGYDF